MTVIEIARRAGVSIGTVDRVLHNRGRVSPATRSRIQSIITVEGYQPNPLARHLKRNRDYRIGVLIPELERESRYWNLIYEGILKATAELSLFSFKIELFDFVRPRHDSLVDAFERMVGSDCCAYIIAPVMQEETLALLTAKHDLPPYTFIDSLLPGASPVSVAAQDPFQGGYIAGRMMDLISQTDGPFAVIRPYTEAYNLNERARGFCTWFSSRQHVRLLDIVCAEVNITKMHSKLSDAFTANPDMRGIFSVTSIGHKVADYIVSQGLKEQVTIIGYDLVAENECYLKEGLLDCLISQRPEEQGRQILNQLYRKIVLAEEPKSRIEMPFDIYFKENLV